MDEITGRDLNDDDLRMEAEIVATKKSKDDEPDSEAAAPQSADDEADACKDEAQDADADAVADESKKDEKNKGGENVEASDEKPETEIV